MRKAAFLLALGLSASFAGTALAQPSPDGAPPGAYPPPGEGPPPGAMTGPQGETPGGAHGPHGIRGKFESANVTHDGRLTEQQAEASGWKGVAKHFAEIDRDNKGYVTEQDVKAWHHARHAEKASMKQQQMAPQGAPPPGAGGPPPGAPNGSPPPGSQPY